MGAVRTATADMDMITLFNLADIALVYFCGCRVEGAPIGRMTIRRESLSGIPRGDPFLPVWTPLSATGDASATSLKTLQLETQRPHSMQVSASMVGAFCPCCRRAPVGQTRRVGQRWF